MSGSRASAASTLLLGGALAGVAFGASSGTKLGPTTIVEILFVLAGGAFVVVAVLFGPRRRFFGVTTLALFALLAVYTALAVLWSVVPALTYVEAGRAFAWLMLFAGALAAARLAPRAAPVALGGIFLAAIVVVLYALASRIWPGALAEDELSNRIGAPFEYWNAVGSAAAMATPIGLWLATRRRGPALLRAAAYPALGACVLAILLTQSRGALLAAIAGALLWLLVVPLRLRSLPAILLPCAGGGLVATWALAKDPFSKPLQPLAAKEAVAGDFGLLVLLMLLALFVGGLIVNVGMQRGLPPVRLRRPLGLAAAVVACVVPLALFTTVAFSDRGLGDRLDDLTSETQTAPDEGAGRIAATSNSRGKYWREARRVFDERPVVGTGPGTFVVTRLRQRTDAVVTAHAHGFVAQTLADMGLVGVALIAALLLAWLVAVLRTLALHPRPRGRPSARRDWDDDRIALVALALVAVVFGIQSTLDWTWFVPAIAAIGLIAAGFVAGRGPAWALAPGAPAATRISPAAAAPAAASGPPPASASEPSDSSATAPLPDALSTEPGQVRRPRLPRPSTERIVVAVGLALVTLLCVWTIWQPEASRRESEQALDLIVAGEPEAAAAKARDAASANPLSPEPLFVEATAQAAAGDREAAARTLERAVLRYPGDPETWMRLGRFQLDDLDRPRDALSTVRGAIYLDPKGFRPARLFLDARIRSRQQATAEQSPANGQPGG